MATDTNSLPKPMSRVDYRMADQIGALLFTFTMPGNGLIRKQAARRGLTCR